MKFIVDAQLPKTLSDFLCEQGLDAIHTLDLPNQNKSSDQQISAIATKEGRVVITKDVDFLESFLVKSIPAKLILIKTGNIHNKDLINRHFQNKSFYYFGNDLQKRLTGNWEIRNCRTWLNN